jgi:hypothetical protein
MSKWLTWFTSDAAPVQKNRGKCPIRPALAKPFSDGATVWIRQGERRLFMDFRHAF